MKILLLLFLFISCSSDSKTEEYEKRKDEAERKRLELKYEWRLAIPYTIEDARNILIEGRGSFKDALLFMEGEGEKEDAALLKDFLERVKKQEGFSRINKRFRTVKDPDFESRCLRVIKELLSPNREKYRYEFYLNHSKTLEHARNVFREGRGDFSYATEILREKGSREDIHLVKAILVRLKHDKKVQKETWNMTNFDKTLMKLIENLKLR